jgi:nucleoside-diphosphate-sugar epimerase
MAERGTIVVTGASGYIGSALLARLRADGYATRAVSRAHAAYPGSDESVVADLRRPNAWRNILTGVAGVVHLSSRTDLRAVEADAASDEDINVVPVRALIDALETPGSRPLPIVFASTATIFGDRPPLPCDETAPDRPLSVYDRHKLTCEVLLKEATANGLAAACTLRLANVYGWAEAVPGTMSTNSNRGIINAMMARAMRGEAVTVYGTGEYVRDFVHIDDVVAAFAAALATGQVRDGGSYVIATGQGHTLTETFSLVVREAKALTGTTVDIRNVPEPADLHQSERRNFIGNSRLFGSRTGWKPAIDLEAGVRRCMKELALRSLAASNS